MKALFLSPHLDDAVFSCGGTMAKLARAGAEVVLATVFTGSVARPRGFALACQLDKGLGPEIDYMALRRDEDRAAAQSLGVSRVVHLGFLEAPHRGYDSAAALFSDVLPGDRGDLALKELLAEEAPDRVFVPQALGGHVDHVRVLDAFLQLDGAATAAFYRDVPYAITRPAARPTGPGREQFESLARGEVDQKIGAAAAYATQLRFQFGGRVAETLEGFASSEGSECGVAFAERFLVR